MPELPEVETMRRGLFPIVGGVISKIEIPKIPYRTIQISPDIKQIRKRCTGKRIVAVDRIAKRVIVRLDSFESLLFQPKMAGIAMLSDPPSTAHIRMILHMQHCEPNSFLYWDRRGLGTIHLWTEEEIQQHLGPDVLGPDALAIEFDVFVSRFRKVNRPVKVALLDQKIMAGVGNLYASEILHRVKIHPAVLCGELSILRWRRIHAATVSILERAIELEGSTLSDGTYRNAINGEGSYQGEHLVYDREGLVCLTCRKGLIVRIVQGQRSSFYCPRCQKA